MKTRNKIQLLAAIAASLVLTACGGGGGPDPGPGSNRFVLNGLVQDAAGAPLAGVQVLLSQITAQSDSQGRFSIGNLPAGSYIVSLQDSAGNFDSNVVSVGATSTDFAFTLPSRSPALHVTRISPALNSSAAALDGEIILEFNKAPAAASVNVDSFSISPSVGELSFSLTDSILRISPRLQLPTGQNMLLEYNGGIIDTAGGHMSQPLRLRFTTTSTDSSAPRIVDVRPAQQAVNHPPNLPLIIDFNEPLAADTSDIIVNTTPQTPYTLRISGNSLMIAPSGGWLFNTDYTLSASHFTDLAGNTGSASLSTTFRTGEQAANAHNLEADWNLTTDTIVFASDLNGNYDIFSIRPDGSELTQLTAFAGNERQPTLNSDGRLLAWQQRDAEGFQQIMLLSLDSPQAQPLQLSSSGYNNTDPSFSRNFNNDIIFVSTRQSITGLWTVNADNLLETELDQSFGSNQYDPAFHPLIDGQILFASGRSGNQDIWRKTISIISGESININLTQQLLSNEHSPAWSPSASFFVFISDFDGHDNLWTGDLTGDFHTQLTYLESDLADPLIDPVSGNNRCLVTMDSETGGSDIVLIDLSSGEVLQNLTGV